MDEGRKRVLGIMAAILASLHMQTADDLFGGPQGSPRTDKLIAASIQWAEQCEVFDDIEKTCRLTNASDHRLQADTPLLTLIIDLFPLSEVLPACRHAPELDKIMTALYQKICGIVSR